MLRRHSGPIAGLATSDDGRVPATASQDGSIRIWRLDWLEPSNTPPGKVAGVHPPPTPAILGPQTTTSRLRGHLAVRSGVSSRIDTWYRVSKSGGTMSQFRGAEDATP